jgi:hypothetical protein
MKHKIKIFCSLFVALLLISCAEYSKKPNYAWWYDISINIEKRELKGLDVSEFSTDWGHATFLSIDSFSRPLTNNEIVELDKSRMVLHLRADVNNDANIEDLYVGAYKTVANTSGKFLAILNSGKLIKYFTHPGNAGFSALLEAENNDLRWYKCLSCGDYDSIVSFDGGIYLE